MKYGLRFKLKNIFLVFEDESRKKLDETILTNDLEKTRKRLIRDNDCKSINCTKVEL